MKKKLQFILAWLQDQGGVLYKKFMLYNKQDRLYIVYLLLLTFFIFFTPLFIKGDSGLGDESTNYYLLNSVQFFVPLVLIVVSLGVLIAWNTSMRAKSLLSALFWFKENTNLLNFVLLFFLTATYSSIGSTVAVLRTNIPTLSLGIGYTSVTLLLIVGLLYNFYLTTTTHKKWRQFHIINESIEFSKDEEMDTLFEEMKDDKNKNSSSFAKKLRE